MGSARLADAVPRIVELYEQGRLKLDELISGAVSARADQRGDCRGGEGGSALRNVIVFDTVSTA